MCLLGVHQIDQDRQRQVDYKVHYGVIGVFDDGAKAVEHMQGTVDFDQVGHFGFLSLLIVNRRPKLSTPPGQVLYAKGESA